VKKLRKKYKKKGHYKQAQIHDVPLLFSFVFYIINSNHKDFYIIKEEGTNIKEEETKAES